MIDGGVVGKEAAEDDVDAERRPQAEVDGAPVAVRAQHVGAGSELAGQIELAQVGHRRSLAALVGRVQFCAQPKSHSTPFRRSASKRITELLPT